MAATWWLILTICFGAGNTACEQRYYPQPLTALQCRGAPQILGPIWHPRGVLCTKILPEGIQPLAPPAQGVVT